jgi:heme A synthase
MARLARYAWVVLVYNLGVIAWGAYVRATGSGAGCGAHWPLCNGDVVPREAAVQTLVEYSHRLTSGLALISVVVLFFWARRVTRPGHPVRTGATLSLAFMLSEAALGAGLVLFQLVADDASAARALAVAAHLLNTFLLLAAITLTVYWASGGGALHRRPGTARLAVGGFALLVVSVMGAITALGDTLFPSTSLGEGLSADLSAASHLLVRLRTVHPVLAVVTALALMSSVSRLAEGRAAGLRAARLLVWLLGFQLAAGFVNVLLLAPVWLQMVHLLLADAIWIAYVFLAADALTATSRQAATARSYPSPAQVH